MECTPCRPYHQDTTVSFEEIEKIFDITEEYASTMIVTGQARCKTCGRSFAFEYDETLVPKFKPKN